MQDQENKFTNDLTPKDLGDKYQNLDSQTNSQDHIDYLFTKEKPHTLKTLSKDIYKTNVEKGFWNTSNSIISKINESELFTTEEITYIENAISSQRLMLIVSEAAEAMEAMRKGKKKAETPLLDKFYKDGYTPTNSPDTFQHFFEKEVKDTYPDEIADTVIRLMDLAEGEGIDLEKHINEKIAYNKTRSAMHGGKKF